MAAAQAGLPVPPHLQRAPLIPRDEWVGSGQVHVDLLCRAIGREDLAGVDLLDVGCGTLLVKTLQDNALPIGHYTGVDLEPEVIEWLQANAADPRFEFHAIDAHNALYNPDGKPLASFDLLPVGDRRFDLISLFAVFTHLAPNDFAAMLRLVRRHVKPEGTLVFSLDLLDAENPSPLETAIRDRLNSDDPEVRAKAAASVEDALRQVAGRGHDPRFKDADPDRPLALARYTRDYAIELVDGTGWEIEAIHPPQRHVHHQMICRPI